MSIEIECIIVCELYGDVLRHSLPINKVILNDITVATSERDLETQNLCEENSVKSFVTNRFFESRNSPFDKEAVLNLCLKNIKKTDWVLLLDADIVLPKNIMSILNSKEFDEEIIYGANRRICTSKEEWNQNNNIKQYICANETRPAGFFQLFHSSSKILNEESPCEENHDFSNYQQESPDFVFAYKFKRYEMIKEFEVLHIGHFNAENWRGRVSPRW